MHKTTFLKTLSLFFFILILSTTQAQNIRITGQIVAEENGLPVPYASISIPGQKTGTSADEQGRFSLMLTKVKPKDVMIISSIGYEPLELMLSEIETDTEVTFRLKTAVLVLEEQVVTAEALDPEDIIRSAAQNLEKNMNSKPYFISSVFSEEIKMNGTVAGVMEGYGITYMGAFRPKNFSNRRETTDQIQWKHIRRSNYDTQDEEITSFIAAYKLMKAKDRYLYDGPVKVSNISNYSYTLDSTSSNKDIPVFIISFQSRNNNNLRGRILVEDESYRIIEMQIDNLQEKRNYESFNKGFKPEKSYFYISFSSVGSLNYINRIYFTIHSMVNKNIVMTEDLKYVAGQFNRSRASRLNEGQLTVLFYEMVNPIMLYNPEYWQNYAELSFPGKSKTKLEEEYEANHGKRIQPLPKGAQSYQQMYNDRQLFDLFITEF